MLKYEENPVKGDDVLFAYTDGASRGNPGPSAASYVFVKNDREVVDEGSKCLGERTNVEAEYDAVIFALDEATPYTRGKLVVRSDNKCVINQINKDWRIKTKRLKPLCDTVYTLKMHFREVEFMHVPRSNKFLKAADDLCNQALDRLQGRRQ